jgi:electron transport complex protein RnfE
MSLASEFIKGLYKSNPVFVLALGLCPTLAVTTAAINAIGMGAAATFVLLGSNILVSLLKDVIPNKVRIPAYIVIIATFVTIVELVMHGFFPPLYKALGIFIPLIVVNCIILGRAEAFANRNGLVASILDALGMGAGFTIALLILGSIRELLGNGTIFGKMVMGTSYEPVLVLILPPGAFITLGVLMGLFSWIEKNRKANK